MGNFFSTPLDSHIRSGETFRDIYVVSRPLESSQRPTHPRAVPSQERPEPVFHWAVHVGGVVYELEKRGTGVIAFGYMEFIEQDWSTKYRVGGTILTDDQLKQKGMPFSQLKSRRLTPLFRVFYTAADATKILYFSQRLPGLCPEIFGGHWTWQD
jgi:hypothetical protein